LNFTTGSEWSLASDQVAQCKGLTSALFIWSLLPYSIRIHEIPQNIKSLSSLSGTFHTFALLHHHEVESVDLLYSISCFDENS